VQSPSGAPEQLIEYGRLLTYADGSLPLRGRPRVQVPDRSGATSRSTAGGAGAATRRTMTVDGDVGSRRVRRPDGDGREAPPTTAPTNGAGAGSDGGSREDEWRARPSARPTTARATSCGCWPTRASTIAPDETARARPPAGRCHRLRAGERYIRFDRRREAGAGRAGGRGRQRDGLPAGRSACARARTARQQPDHRLERRAAIDVGARHRHGLRRRWPHAADRQARGERRAAVAGRRSGQADRRKHDRPGARPGRLDGDEPHRHGARAGRPAGRGRGRIETDPFNLVSSDGEARRRPAERHLRWRRRVPRDARRQGQGSGNQPHRAVRSPARGDPAGARRHPEGRLPRQRPFHRSARLRGRGAAGHLRHRPRPARPDARGRAARAAVADGHRWRRDRGGPDDPVLAHGS
jgi:hypothetical protein